MKGMCLRCHGKQPPFAGGVRQRFWLPVQRGDHTEPQTEQGGNRFCNPAVAGALWQMPSEGTQHHQKAERVAANRHGQHTFNQSKDEHDRNRLL